MIFSPCRSSGQPGAILDHFEDFDFNSIFETFSLFEFPRIANFFLIKSWLVIIFAFLQLFSNLVIHQPFNHQELINLLSVNVSYFLELDCETFFRYLSVVRTVKRFPNWLLLSLATWAVSQIPKFVFQNFNLAHSRA